MLCSVKCICKRNTIISIIEFQKIKCSDLTMQSESCICITLLYGLIGIKDRELTKDGYDDCNNQLYHEVNVNCHVTSMLLLPSFGFSRMH